MPFWGLNRPETTPLGTEICIEVDSVFSICKARCQGGELLILRFGRQTLVNLGIIDDIAEQFLAERGQSTFPKLPRGLAFLHEDPFLGRDRASIHPVGEVVDAAA